MAMLSVMMVTIIGNDGHDGGNEWRMMVAHHDDHLVRGCPAWLAIVTRVMTTRRRGW